MSLSAQSALQPRKSPVQARSTATVEAISEATIQVLLAVGPGRLTTTRVAERAGVSVGTLYQYFPNKEAMLFFVLEHHLNVVANAVERACRRSHGQTVKRMMEAVVQAFIDAKMKRADISMALYRVASDLDVTALVRQSGERGRAALATMLETASDAVFEELPVTTLVLYSAMAGTMRSVLEAGSPPELVTSLRTQLVLLCSSFLVSAGRR